MQVSKRVHLIGSGHLGCTLTHPNDCNVYAVRCGDRYLVIDAGVGVETQRIIDELKGDGLRADQLESLLLTHGHLDHAGGSACLQRELKLFIVASEGTASALTTGDESAISLRAAKAAGIYDPSFRFEACQVARVVRGGECWAVGDCTITALATPGHSRDMLTYLVQSEDELLAFTGDTLFHGGKVLLSDTWDCEPAACARSVRTLAGYEIDGFYPGHGIWSVRDGSRHVRLAMQFVERLLLPPNLL